MIVKERLGHFYKINH